MLRFSEEEAYQASDEWNFNCGPASLCAVLNMTSAEIRPRLLDFERKGYTNPTLMRDILHGLGVDFARTYECRGANRAVDPVYPTYGLVRIQWDGPWCAPGVPVRARYRYTHWVAVRPTTPRFAHYMGGQPREVFDVNTIRWGGWGPWDGWRQEVVPWLLKELYPKANGDWWPTHCWEIPRPEGAT